MPSVKVSSPAVTLEMAAARLYGITDFARFDAATITMSPADATIALLTGSGEVNCVMALPPYLQQQLEHPNIHAGASSFDLAGGPTTYTVAYTSMRFHDRNPKLYQADEILARIALEDNNLKAAGELADAATALVRRYIDDLIAGDESGAYAALGGTSSDRSLSLKEEAFLDKDAHITSIHVSRADASGATIDAEITSTRGSYVATFHVTSGPNGAIINQHDYIKI